MHRTSRSTQYFLIVFLFAAPMGMPVWASASESHGSTANEPAEPAISPAVLQLRHAAGLWDATTEFLAPDGSVARSVQGTYEFEWVVPDRVLQGVSTIPELDQVSALLFYFDESKDLIGMSSVGADGHLWVMTGPADSEVRTTPPTPMDDGTTLQLRFTRYNVEPNSFESKMETSIDGGVTWRQGNRQVFTRRATAADSSSDS